MHIVGVHLDRKSTQSNVDRIVGEIKNKGRESLFFNVNAADPEKRREVLDAVHARIGRSGVESPIRVLLHSLAFGTLKPFIDRKSTRLNSSHGYISYAVFCLKKKKKTREPTTRILREWSAARERA